MYDLISCGERSGLLTRQLAGIIHPRKQCSWHEGCERVPRDAKEERGHYKSGKSGAVYVFNASTRHI